MQTTLLIVLIGVLILVFVAFTVMLFIWFSRKDLFQETETLLEHQKNEAKLLAKERNPPKYVPKPSMSRLAMILSVGTLCLSTIALVATYIYLAIDRPDDLNCLDLKRIKWILLMPVLGVLPYLFNQLKRVRL